MKLTEDRVFMRHVRDQPERHSGMWRRIGRAVTFVLSFIVGFIGVIILANAATYGPYPQQFYETCGNPKATTVVLDDHGGWDMSGTLNSPDSLSLCSYLASRGVYVVRIEYRLTTVASWPAQWMDLQAAVRYFRSLGYARVGIVGQSAGAYNVLGVDFAQRTIIWPSVDPKNEAALYPGVSSRPDFAVAVSPISDLNDDRLWDPAVVYLTHNLHPATGGMSLMNAHAMASPITQIHSDIPATLIIHGKVDTTVPVKDSRVLAAQLAWLHAPAKYIETNGAHVFTGLTAAEHTMVFQAIGDCVVGVAGGAFSVKP